MTGMIETCQFCGRVIPGKARTNGDMIRSMTDEELAKAILKLDMAETIPFCKNKAACTKMLDKNIEIPECACYQCLLDWLRGEEATKDERWEG